MGVYTYESEETSDIPAPKLFKVFALDSNNILPKIAPQAIKSVEILKGDGGPGTIRKITFGEGSHYGYLKQKIVSIDKENYVYNYSLIEGSVMSDTIEKIDYETKLVAAPHGGTIIKRIGKYHTKGDVEIKEEHVKAYTEMSSNFFKLIEGYLKDHPSEYN